MGHNEADLSMGNASHASSQEPVPDDASAKGAEALRGDTPLPAEPAWLVDQLEQAPLPPEPAWDDPLFWGDKARGRMVQDGPLHPSGQWQVLQGWGDDWRSVVVRDLLTQQTVWGPAGAILIAWSPDGDQVGVISESYTYNPALHRIVATRFQSEYRYAFERYTWPALQWLGACPLQMPTGWPVLLTLWPEQQVAVFQWRDQNESGLEFIHLSEAGNQQLQHAGFPQLEEWTPKTFHPPGGIALGTTWITGPVFSLSGRFIAMGLPGNFDAEGHVIEPTYEGMLPLGEVLILDWHERALGRLAVSVPAETMQPFITPAYPFDVFQALTFLGEEGLELVLSNGTKQRFLFHQEGSWIQPSQRTLDL